ncbi:hypothetical protein [Streptomyces sp. ODS05-4]|uniref:hypothetical protein n=1 Tax=Streptomyces sp. ODS05-4 TaxID=2944939 RepID=UPI00210E55E5|nr:hypothetical protein [Streptomyces sp. ODS05-4]
MSRSKWCNAAGAATAAGAVLMLAAGPAAAAPNWQPWVAPANYTCGPTTTHRASVNVSMQTCVIKGAGNNYQAVAIVSNNASVSVKLEAAVYVNPDSSGHTFDECYQKTVAAHTRVACFGYSRPSAVTPVDAYSAVRFNGLYNDTTAVAVYR